MKDLNEQEFSDPNQPIDYFLFMPIANKVKVFSLGEMKDYSNKVKSSMAACVAKFLKNSPDLE